MLHTVKKAPVTRADMPNRRATIRSREPISERKALNAVSDARTPADVVPAAASAAAKSVPFAVTASTVAKAPELPVLAATVRQSGRVIQTTAVCEYHVSAVTESTT